ncbi:MAG: hypothetical protein ACLFU7_03210 [Armatimonadota bacterium]
MHENTAVGRKAIGAVAFNTSGSLRFGVTIADGRIYFACGPRLLSYDLSLTAN